MEILSITSAQNPTIKKFSSFSRKKTPQLIQLDGAHLNQEYLKATGKEPEITLVSQRFLASDDFKTFTDWQSLIQIPDSLMAKLSPTKTPSGLLSLAPQPEAAAPAQTTLTLIFENIQDPGNLGTMLRTANAFGPGTILLSGECCDVWNEKCLRAGMGAQFYVSCQKITSLAEWKKTFTGTLVGTSLQGENLWQSALPSTVAFLFGNEGQGVTASAQALCDQNIKIPMSPNAESLNVAASLAILTHEFKRQQKSNA